VGDSQLHLCLFPALRAAFSISHFTCMLLATLVTLPLFASSLPSCTHSICAMLALWGSMTVATHCLHSYTSCRTWDGRGAGDMPAPVAAAACGMKEDHTPPTWLPPAPSCLLWHAVLFLCNLSALSHFCASLLPAAARRCLCHTGPFTALLRRMASRHGGLASSPGSPADGGRCGADGGGNMGTCFFYAQPPAEERLLPGALQGPGLWRGWRATRDGRVPYCSSFKHFAGLSTLLAYLYAPVWAWSL